MTEIIEDRAMACTEEMQETGGKQKRVRTKARTRGRPPKGTMGVIAAQSLHTHPDWTAAMIAESIGCNRTSLYRLKEYRVYRDMLKRQKLDRPRGSVSLDANGLQQLEAWSVDDDDLVGR